MRLLFALLFMAFFTCDLLGQGKEIRSEYFANYASKKPQAGSLGTFGNTAINYYTGLPEISLDLFQLPAREKSLPITLNYDASGIRTDELSGPAGIKWTLNAGGMIMRQLNGLPDEHALGYLKFAAETNYYTNIQPTDWAQWCERNDKDYAPDEFSVMLPGRTIRFVFNKDRHIVPIPRQNIQATYAIEKKFDASNGREEDRISRFEITVEDGTRYVFGGSDASVEERRVQTLVVGGRFDFKTQSDCPDSPYPFPDPVNTGDVVRDCQSSFHVSFSSLATLSEKSIGFFNHRWLLQTIHYPNGDQIDFTYQRLADVIYAMRPSSLAIAPIAVNNPKYVYEKEVCADLFCLSKIKQRYVFYNILATKKYSLNNPGSGPTNLDELFPPPPSSPPPMFDVIKYSPTPGAVNFYHTLITESNTKLLEIKTNAGNRITLTTSVREDLPNAVKYDLINLYNMNNTLIKSVRLNYSIVSANEQNEFFWFSEALLMKEFSSLKENTSVYFANYVKKHLPSDIPNPLLRKYIYEGLKDYNYKRTFLQSVVDVTNSSVPISLYDFNYTDLHQLRRRTTTLHDPYGYHRLNSQVEYFSFTGGKQAAMSNSFNPYIFMTQNRSPKVGLISQIRYPTGGKTNFHFTSALSPKLSKIEDVDNDGRMLHVKELETYPYLPTPGIFVGYQDFRVEDTMDWMKYRILSSAPLNDSHNYTQGVLEANYETIVYHGTKANNNGFERFLFSTTGDVATNIQSVPAETNLDGSSLKHIFPYPKNSERDHLRGHLSRHAIYRKGSPLEKPIKETVYHYKINPYGYSPQIIRGFKGGTFNWTTKSGTSFWHGYETEAQKRYRYATYEIRPDWFILEKTEEIIYDETDANRKTNSVTELTYDITFIQPVEVRKYISAQPGIKQITRTRYATDPAYSFARTDCESRLSTCNNYCTYNEPKPLCFSKCSSEYQSCLGDQGSAETAALLQLRKTNQHTTPVEIQHWVEESGMTKLVSSVIHMYQIIGPLKVVRPAQIWTISNTISGSFTPSKVNSLGGFEFDPRHRRVHSFNSYDPATYKLLSQSTLDGTTVQSVWGYNGSLVVEQAINPGVEEQRSRYTHIPLAGVSAISDENGIKTSFTFDGNNRLLHVKDHHDRILKRHRYHYSAEEYNGALSASFTVTGPLVQGSSIAFSCPPESREYGSISYTWDFGDGRTQLTTFPNISHTYSAPGTYRVTLRKSHPEFGSSTASTVISVTAGLSISVCIDGYYMIDIPPSYMSPASGSCTTSPIDPNKTTLRSTVVGGCGSYTYQWQYLSSGVWITYSTTGPTSTPPADFTNKVLGSYKIRCVVRDSCGNQVTSDVKDLAII